MTVQDLLDWCKSYKTRIHRRVPVDSDGVGDGTCNEPMGQLSRIPLLVASNTFISNADCGLAKLNLLVLVYSVSGRKHSG